MPERPHHRRLSARDYTHRDYFITLCAKGRMKRFGERDNGIVRLNALGRAVEDHWRMIADIYPTVRLDTFVVMPEHLHGILLLGVDGPSKNVGTIINQFKGAVSKRAAREFNVPAGTLWQRDLYERAIRADAMDDIRRYIDAHRNPDA